MKILHIMHEDKFTEGVLNFYDSVFDNGCHSFLILLDEDKSQYNNHSVSIEKHIINKNSVIDSFRVFYEIIRGKYDYVVFHSLVIGDLTKLLLIISNAMKKVVWIEWGGDLYSWEKNENSIISICKNQIGKYFRNNVFAFIAIFPPDISKYTKDFPNSQSKIYYAPYLSFPNDVEKLEYKNTNPLRTCLQNNEPIYILVGHNGMDSLNHIDVLKCLEKYRNQNIRVVLPLSYGGTIDYIEKVSKYAMKAFGDKAIILKELIPKEEYLTLLNKVSIAIFNTNRQCGLGNIHCLLFNNVKLYLTESGVMYDYFLSNGVPVEKYENIEKNSFFDFVKPMYSNNPKKLNEYINELQSSKIGVERWKSVYDDLYDNLGGKIYEK